VETFDGPDARQYIIFDTDGSIAAHTADFVTDDEPDGRSCHEVAVGNLTTFTETASGRYVLVWLPADGDPVPLAHARDGVARLMVGLDDLQAGSWFGRMLTPAQRARAAFNVRRGLDEPTMWGQAS
jgi:hypothetical protein